MCGGIEYQGHKVYFPNPEARLTVLLKSGEITWVPWGWRNKTDRKFVAGGWARHESILAHKWKAWHPRPVLVMCDRFMEKEEEGTSHWFDVSNGMAIQGLLAERDDTQLVYVVTEQPPPNFAWVHDRWPRLVNTNASTQLHISPAP
jgi:putative SOS response-associated peptidase YedK